MAAQPQSTPERDPLRDHVRVAIASLSLGFLDEFDVESALMRALQRADNSIEAVWGGRLSPEQLEAILNCWGDPIPSIVATRLGLGAALEPRPGGRRAESDIGSRNARDEKARYQRVRVVGSGGAGEIYEALDATLQRSVAMKIFHKDVGIPGNLREELDREARITSSLEHPNIIPIYDAGATEDGEAYYVMRLVNKPTLLDAMERVEAGGEEAERAYPLARRLRHFMQVCDAVDYAHSRGIVHCDLKPSNILLGPFGEVLIVDWGLAHDLSDGSGIRGGTPAYMAPEQLDASIGKLGPPADVFALGAILYETVGLCSVFPRDSQDALAERRKHRIAPLSEVAKCAVADELEAICMRCLELDPRNRFPSARAISTAIEEFLEGTRERDRRLAACERLVNEADELAARHLELIDQCAEQEADVDALRRRTRPWADLQNKQALWKAEDLIEVTESLRVRTLQAAGATYEQALDLVPDHAPAKCGLAKVYQRELELARRRRDTFNELYFTALVDQHDDGKLVSASQSEGVLLIECFGRASDLYLEPIVERQRRMVPLERRQSLPCGQSNVAPGRYRVIAQRDGAELAVYPLLVAPGAMHSIRLDLDAASEVGSHEAYIPGGLALLGGAVGAPREVLVPAFAIGRLPVTFAEYLEFVTAVCNETGAPARRLLPMGRSAQPYFRREGSGWLPAHLPTLAPGEDPMRLPAFGVDALSAQAYADWVSRRTGQCHRLPTPLEWEKAARGTDGRRFPWGDRFDAGFCKMRESRQGLSRPEAVGAFEADESPYGVRDLAGGIAEWVMPRCEEESTPTPATRRYGSRGGAWCDWEDDCRLAVGRSYFAIERSARLGFRLVREVAR